MERIKALIFDLDDTLYDCSGLLVDNSRRRAAKVIAQSGFPWNEEKIYNTMIEIVTKNSRADIFEGLINLVGKEY